MTAARTKAPTLAWLLTALTGLLAGLAIGENRHQAVALPVDVVATLEAAGPPTGTPAPTLTSSLGPREALDPSPTLFSEDVPVRLEPGPALLRLARLTVPPGGELSSGAATGPTVLLVETGTLSIRVDGWVRADLGLAVFPTTTVLGHGARLVIAPGAGYAARNDGPGPAVALLVAVVPAATPTPILGPGEPPTMWVP